ncbi:Uncharacterised protein [Mycobacterium tuberculosis]|nr:Uncharacterised protein [Mycobacterium tuberculosis]
MHAHHFYTLSRSDTSYMSRSRVPISETKLCLRIDFKPTFFKDIDDKSLARHSEKDWIALLM